jgi:hypothetical protein
VPPRAHVSVVLPTVQWRLSTELLRSWQSGPWQHAAAGPGCRLVDAVGDQHTRWRGSPARRGWWQGWSHLSVDVAYMHVRLVDDVSSWSEAGETINDRWTLC